MKYIIKNAGLLISSCALITGLYSCSGNETTNSTRCADSIANASKTTTTTTTVTTTTDTAGAGNGGNANGTRKVRSAEEIAAFRRNAKMENDQMNKERKKTRAEEEPTGPQRLSVSSAAFANGGVIPVKYTCKGQGATPPFQVTNIPHGTISMTLIVHDYEATPEGGLTYWMIWDLDSTGFIPENFVNDNEAMNKAHQYGYDPICPLHGNHRYHFIFYALDTKLVMDKNTTKSKMEAVMRGHVLGKGEIVGTSNRQLEGNE